MPEKREIENVSWINVVPLNVREKIGRWWVDSVRQQHTYTSQRQREQPFQTSIPVASIDQLASEGLKAALLRQKRGIEEDSSIFTLPRATPDGSVYFGSVTVRRRIEFPIDGE